MFVTSHRGNKQLIYHNHKFGVHKACSTASKTRWRCTTHHSKGCKAFIVTSGDKITNLIIRFVTSNRGSKQIVYDNYKFGIHKASCTVSKTRWRCTTHHARGCKAYIVTCGDEIVKLNNDHEHDIADGGNHLRPISTPQFVTSNRGNKHILLGGYKFGIHKTKGLKTRWLCTAHNSKACYASLMTIENQVINGLKFTYITSRRGMRQIKIGNYKFGIRSTSMTECGVKSRWVCTAHRKNCPATIMLLNDQIVSIHNPHTH
ncbi:hypothetical protein JYU34_004401 [Plutella xylostella]|uniref:FLYWCH-type domain-containing protein n=1 Tax=Plutella xylostella TaxID=51655 RepID=A0ABQ7QXV6_PLUXY|nr:hypothetical protein JYU34_004401 [Plutella xylostella]